jgi:hypothetical protein
MGAGVIVGLVEGVGGMEVVGMGVNVGNFVFVGEDSGEESTGLELASVFSGVDVIIPGLETVQAEKRKQNPAVRNLTLMSVSYLIPFYPIIISIGEWK